MREFRAHHDGFVSAGVALAGVSLEPLETLRAEASRLALPYPLLSDVERRAGETFHVITRLGLGGWNVELFRRTTALIDARGIVSAVWGKVRVRGHALEVLGMARRLDGA